MCNLKKGIKKLSEKKPEKLIIYLSQLKSVLNLIFQALCYA